ncbi:hypothetical protein A8M77_19505 [Variovorax sp. JS1663]|nr:hypothetical protein A8M77_19505 [Variovorax sp. JS1663]
MHALLAVAFGIAVFAVAVTGWWASTYWIPLQDVKGAVRAKLDNGASAQFEHVWYSKQTRVGCGYVSVKEPAGGYKGKKHFILFPGGELQLEPSRETQGDAAQQIAALEQQARYAQAIRANCLQ